MFDPFKQAILQNSYSKMKEVSIPEKDTSIDELKRLSGIDARSKQIAAETQANKAKFMAENNIKPGTDAWFKLWFAKPEITGEDPFGRAKTK